MNCRCQLGLQNCQYRNRTGIFAVAEAAGSPASETLIELDDIRAQLEPDVHA
jgi:hypothetical protein